MKYKGIIFDVDGTAVPLAGKVASLRLQKAIAAASKIAKVSAATGRSYGPAKPIFESMGLIFPCVTMGGSAIINPLTDEVVWSMPMGVDQTDEVLDVVGRYQTDLHLGVSAAEPSIRLADYRKH
jgi:hydroxymethylpyrimidine pyrophosphatase-like HAD family hydrolase